VLHLPDMQRGIGEQEDEIKELEDKIAEQRQVLERLKELGLKIAAQRDTEGDVMET
jgi:uncharacterized coiled-coil protein SlyX